MTTTGLRGRQPQSARQMLGEAHRANRLANRLSLAMPASISMAESPWSPRWVFGATLVAVAVACAFLLAYLFRGALLLLFLAILISTALKPIAGRLRRSGASPLTSALAVYGLLVVILIGIVVAGAPMLASQASQMLEGLPKTYQRIHEYLAGISHPIAKRIVSELPDELPKTLDLDSEETAGAIQAAVQGAGYGRVALQGLLAGLATILLAFYWSLYEDRAIRACLLVVPSGKRDAARDLVAEVQNKLGAFLRGQFLLCAIMAVMAFVVYWLIGLPYVVALAVAAGCLEAVPVFGPVLAAVPALAVALSVSPTKAAWTLAAIVIMQQIEGNVLVPRIMDRSVGVSSIVTLLAILALSSMGGLAGAVLAIPFAAIVQLLFERWLFNREASEPAPPEGRDAVSRLRYEAQQLAHDVQLQIREKQNSPSPKNDRLEETIEELARDLELFLASTGSTTAIAASVVASGEPR
jgi:predicted PurR-regulated permease PerM